MNPKPDDIHDVATTKAAYYQALANADETYAGAGYDQGFSVNFSHRDDNADLVYDEAIAAVNRAKAVYEAALAQVLETTP